MHQLTANDNEQTAVSSAGGVNGKELDLGYQDGVLRFNGCDGFVPCAPKQDSWILTIAVTAIEGIC